MMLALAAAAAAAAALQPATVVTVPPKHALIEGIASDGKAIYLSSLVDRQILRCTTSCRVLATLPKGLHPFAIAWDDSRKRLWVAADCPPGVPFITACERGALIGLDTRGRVRTRIAPPIGTFHPGDVSASDSQVFVSDSQNGSVYRLTPNGQALMALVEPGIGKSGQGSAHDPAGSRVIVADYSQGIAAIDLPTGARTLLLRDNDRPLRGIDGLVRCGDTYLGIYNGQTPGGLVAFTINGGKIAAREPVAGLTLPDPTQLTLDDERLLLVANSGWEGAIKGTPRTEGTRIVSLPRAAVCGAAAPTASSGR